MKGYKFKYDELSRLKEAIYGEGASLADNKNRYDEAFTYSLNGNIRTLQRRGLKDDNGFNLIDNLTMEYSSNNTGNLLTKITEPLANQSSSGLMEFRKGSNTGTQYYYDYTKPTVDYNRGICKINYNYLALPRSVQFAYGHRIEYVYDGSGRKLQVKHREAVGNLNVAYFSETVPPESSFRSTVTTDYVDNKIYVNGVLHRVLHEEGYTEWLSASSYLPYYFIKDHLGNNRKVLGYNGYDEQLTDYYPSGVTMAKYPRLADIGDQPYKYNGKELDAGFGLNWYDYDARQYDPTIMRFTTHDPLREKYYSVSPYAYCHNNPINRIDPDGKDDFFYNQTGEEINRIKTEEFDRFYLEHADGNQTISDRTYYQGLTKESFFGDRGNQKAELFEKVDIEALNSDKKIVATVDNHTRKDETKMGFLKESPEGKHYDYKNTVLGPLSKDEINNGRTAYMYNGVLYNRNEAGNVLWGATSAKLGFTDLQIHVGVHGFSIINEGKFDERGEQISIAIGRIIYEREKNK